MNLFAIRKYVDRLLHPIVSSLARLPLHANAWTLFGAGVGLVGGVVLSTATGGGGSCSCWSAV